MTIKMKTNITALALAALALFLIFFAIIPLFNQIKTGSENLIIQKNKLIELEAKIKNFQNFKDNFKQYQPNLEKMDKLFIDASEPIDFIEFMEDEASISELSIEIAPPVSREKDSDIWPALEFGLNLEGSLPDFLRFLDRLESGPYLIMPMSLSIRKISTKDAISAILSIKTYAR